MNNILKLAAAVSFLVTIYIFLPGEKENQKILTNENEIENSLLPESFKDLWMRVDTLLRKGRWESALKVVDEIYLKAELEKNDAQLAKSLIHFSLYTSKIEDEYFTIVIKRYAKEIQNHQGPLKNVLQSCFAEILWSYYQRNYWQWEGRTTVEDFKLEDMETWDLRTLADMVKEMYLVTLQNSAELKKIPLTDYDEIIVDRVDSKKYRPTLYDFLANRVLDFLETNQTYLTEPSYQFKLDQPAIFSPPATFLLSKFETRDSSSSIWRAIQVYKDLLDFHKSDVNPAAFAMADYRRYSFAKNYSIVDKKKEKYISSLEYLEAKLGNDTLTGYFAYQRAVAYNNDIPVSQDYNEWGWNDDFEYDYEEQDNDLDSSLVKNRKIAWGICKDVLTKWPDSRIAENCRSLVFNIEHPSVKLKTESIVVPGQWSRIFVSYTNCSKLHFRLAKMSTAELTKLNQLDKDEIGAALHKIVPMKSWQQQIPDPGDYNKHSVEVGLEPLELGEYILLSCPDPSFPVYGSLISYSAVAVSKIGYTSKQDRNGKIDFYVFDRESGSPLQNVNCQVVYSEYEYTLRKYVTRKGTLYHTDINGHFAVPPVTSSSKGFSVEFALGSDKCSTYSSFYEGIANENRSEPTKSLRIFTDRSIYRPGQQIFFKGILQQTFQKKMTLLPHEEVNVEFRDANSKEITTAKFTTNDYGSFAGSFTAPQGLLTGSMSIGNYNGRAYFSVEEYKRPKFEATFNPVKESFRLNDKVTVKGSAKAYAGSVIDNAKVHYRVVRNASFPYWFWWRSAPSSPEMEIASGDTTTNELGDFSISFKAIPDAGISNELKPVFYYYVTADITDVTGETRSTSTSVAVGAVALDISLGIPAVNVDREKKNEWGIHSRNLNGEFEAAKGTISVAKLKGPDRVLRNRYWGVPDQFVFTKDEFVQKFPNDVYKDEDEVRTWAKAENVLNVNFDTQKDDTLKLAGMNSWPEGNYVVELISHDKYGIEVRRKEYIVVYSSATQSNPTTDLNWYHPLDMSGEPGEEVSFALASAEKDVPVWMEIVKGDKVISSKWITLSQSKHIEKIPVLEEYRGNFTCNLFFGRHSRLYTKSMSFTVPWTNKELKVQFETFRNKLIPGAKEEWKIKITGPGGEAVAAEMLAGMYDASLDAFRGHSWYLENHINDYNYDQYRGDNSFGAQTTSAYNDLPRNPYYIYTQEFDFLNWFGFYVYGNNRHGGELWDFEDGSDDFGGDDFSEDDEPALGFTSTRVMTDSVAVTTPRGGMDQTKSVAGRTFDNGIAMEGQDERTGETGNGMGEVSIRKNLNELAFFYPQLQTNEKGEIIFSFTVPEALTKWKFMALAHTTDLKVGQLQKEAVTQKDLMIMPNPPRFLREGDKIFFTAKVSNLSEGDLSGEASLEIFNALTMEPVDVKFKNSTAAKAFTAKKGQSAGLSWELNIPEGVEAITYRVKAKANNFTDGEEAPIPILTNRMLVTESMPLPMRANQTKTFTFDKLINNTSATLRNHKLTLEYTSNPAWYAVQALPYLMEYPYECSEQTFSRYYANSLASFIANSNPKIKAVFDAWKAAGKESLLSNLEKNQELKYVLLEETPWVRDGQNESERKARVGLLFDLNHIADELSRTYEKLRQMQVPNGGFPWFKGMPDDPYISQHIMAGMGKLKHLGVLEMQGDVQYMIRKLVAYCDARMQESYAYIKKTAVNTNDDHIGYNEIHYLYARSFFFEEHPITKANTEAFEYFKGQAKKYWLDKGRYSQGMMALSLFRSDETTIPNEILLSLKEGAMKSEELGMYWKENVAGYYWYEAPIEFQAMMIEAFDEVGKDQAIVDELKLWLLKNKQTNDWKTTKATVEASYALLLRGTDFLSESKIATIKVGNMTLDPSTMPDVKVEAGTGYFKTSWSGTEIKPEMGNVEVTNPNQVASWGAMYWQYFEQLDKITPSATPISIKKDLFLQKESDKGPVLTPVNETTSLKPGDLIKVRMEIRVDREMNYVHIKDMRASGFEPVNVLSQYKWQDGLGYYESTRDASTNFFISWLPKGTYVFEYPVRVAYKGDFSNGITTIQCMYAPEFTSHTQGIRVKVD